MVIVSPMYVCVCQSQAVARGLLSNTTDLVIFSQMLNLVFRTCGVYAEFATELIKDY